MLNGIVVCDAQVHGPDLPVGQRTVASVGGMDPDPLEAEMHQAHVDCAVIVPLTPDDNDRAIGAFVWPGGPFGVMPAFPLPDVVAGRQLTDLVGRWSDTAGVVGIRTSFYHDEVRPLLVEERLEWLWEAAAAHDLAVAINAPGNAAAVAGIARRHPKLQVILDHMNLEPFGVYSDFSSVLATILPLADHPNIAIKVSGLPRSVEQEYPFPLLHEPLREVVRGYGAERVFWGSDITRQLCSYSDCARLFQEGLTFLDDEQRRWILGKGLLEWIGWTEPLEVRPAELGRGA